MGIARNIARLIPNGSGELPTANLQNSAITSTKLANNIALPGTASATLPIGTSAQRPSSAEGLVRFNTDKKTLEGVLSTQWSRDWQALTMAPCFYGFNSIDTSGVNGWKAIRVNPDFRSGLAGSTAIYNSSNGTFQPNEEGWYVMHFGHAHQNGAHGNYRIRMVHSHFDNIGYLWAPNSSNATVTAVSYFNGVDHSAQFLTYHDNTNHPDDNGQRMIYQAVFRIIGADN